MSFSGARAPLRPEWLSRRLAYEEAASLALSFLCLVLVLSLVRKWDVHDGHAWTMLAVILATLGVVLRSFQEGVDRWLLAVPLAMAFEMWTSWPWSANHVFFALWVTVPAIFRPGLATSEAFSRYVSVTFGIMMLYAGIQKLIGGHFWDGSMLAWLAVHGSGTERLVNLACGGALTARDMTPCTLMVLLSRAVLAWQFVVASLFLLCLRSPFILAIEAVFLLSVGVVADELTFQALNLLALVFVARRDVPAWLFFAIIPFNILGMMRLEGVMHAVS